MSPVLETLASRLITESVMHCYLSLLSFTDKWWGPRYIIFFVLDLKNYITMNETSPNFTLDNLQKTVLMLLHVASGLVLWTRVLVLVLEEMKDSGINLYLPVLAGLTWFLWTEWHSIITFSYTDKFHPWNPGTWTGPDCIIALHFCKVFVSALLSA